MSVLAVALAPKGRLGAGSAELVGCAQEAAAILGQPVVAGVVGAPPEPDGQAALAEQLWQLGAQKIYFAWSSALAEPRAELYLQALEPLVRAAGASAVVLNGDPFGAELGPRLAMRLRAASVTDVVAVRDLGGRPGWVRPTYGGKAMAVLSSRRDGVVITVRPRAFPAPQARAGAPGPDAVATVALDVGGPAAERVRVVERQSTVSEGVRLEDARVIVSGGRGMGGPEAFRELEELARILGGAVGASRAAADAGWVPASLQIGQTGKIVSPDLYIAVGISGASQHLAGVSGARHIVAINKDPEAPIFKAAEVGVVEDYRKVLPLLIQRLRQVMGRDSAAAG